MNLPEFKLRYENALKDQAQLEEDINVTFDSELKRIELLRNQLKEIQTELFETEQSFKIDREKFYGETINNTNHEIELCEKELENMVMNRIESIEPFLIFFNGVRNYSSYKQTEDKVLVYYKDLDYNSGIIELSLAVVSLEESIFEEYKTQLEKEFDQREKEEYEKDRQMQYKHWLHLKETYKFE